MWGIPVSNPVGLAAGFDKEGEAIDGEPACCMPDRKVGKYALQQVFSTSDSAG